MKFRDIDKKDLLVDMTENQLVKATELLSANFTKNRNRIDQYVKTDELVSAYTWFFMPTNKSKLGFLLDQLTDDTKKLIFSRPFIDFGCGPGTYSWAMMEYAQHHKLDYNQSFLLIDASKAMLKQAMKIHQTCYPYKEIINFFKKIPPHSVKDPVLLFGNSLNEMNTSLVKKIITDINPIAICLIEPGTKSSFKQILEVRSHLVARNYQILYPCMLSSGCPSKPDDDEWCHQVVLPSYPDSILRKIQLTSLNRRTLPMIGHIYFRADQIDQSPLNAATIYRFLGESKASIDFQICSPDPLKLELSKLEVEKRSLTKADRKQLKSLSSGVRITFETIKKFGGNIIRARNVKTSLR